MTPRPIGPLLFKIMYAFCLHCPSATFALQYGGFVPREWLAAKGSIKTINKDNWKVPHDLIYVFMDSFKLSLYY